MSRRSKLLTVFAVTLMASMAIVPAVMGSFSLSDDGLDIRSAQDADALAPLVILGLGLLIGGGIGAGSVGLLWFLSDDGGNDDSLPDYTSEYREQAKDFEAYIGTHIADLNGGLNIDTQMMAFSQYYWNRVAEVAVADLWTASSEMNADSVLLRSTIMQNLSVHYRSWESIIDTPFGRLADIPLKNAAAGYSEIEWGLYIDDVKFTASRTFSYDAATFVDGATSGRAYLTTETQEGATPYMDRLYVFETGTLISDDGTRYNLSPGTYPLSDFKEGYYTISGGKFAGPFLPAGTNPADLKATLVAAADGKIGYALQTDTGYTMVFDRVTYTGSDIGMYASYPDSETGTAETSRSAGGLLDSWSTLLNGYESMISQAITSARAMWMLYDDAGSANSQVSLSAFVPDLSNINMTAEQIYAIGLLSMIQASEWYKTSSATFDQSSLRISESSMEMFVTGSVKAADGTYLVENAVYTPFCYLNSARIFVGDVTWNQPGFVISWGDAETWNGKADLTTMQLIPLVSGMELEVESISYLGEDVESMYLEVKSMDLVLSPYREDYEPEPIPPYPHYAVLITVIMLMAALGAGIMSVRSGSIVGIIIALIIAAVGWIWPDVILGLIF